MKWTAAQQEVIEHQAGWLRVCGPAGSGKTTALVARWRRAALAGRPDRVLVLCRSRDLADMFRRAALGEVDRPWAAEVLPFSTVYGAAYDLVRRHRGDRRLLTRAEQWSVVRRMLAADSGAQWPSCPEFVHRPAFVDEVAAAVLAVEAGGGAGDGSVLAVAEADGQGERWADLLAFRRRYRRVTSAMGAIDGAQLFTEAAEILADRVVAAAESDRWDEILLDDADAVTAPMGRLIERLAPGRLVASGHDSSAVAALGPDDGGRGGAGEASWWSASWFDRLAGPATVRLEQRHRAPQAGALLRCRHPAGEPDAIAGVLREAHADGVAWHDMAVLMRSERQRAQGIGRALARHGIPVRVTPGSPAAEPAVRALTDFFAWASGDRSALDRLLVSPAVDLGPGELRRLRRAAALGGPSLADHPRLVELAALRDRVAPRLATDPADLVHQVWVELLGGLVPDPDAGRPDVIAARALDAVAAFVAGVSGRSAHDPSWRIADELALVEGPDFEPDPWVPLSRAHDEELVTVTTIRSAGGRAWDTVVIAGCLEGELPRISGAARFFDRSVPERAGQGDQFGAGGGLPTPGERRRVSLEEERRLFELATSRSRRRLVATAAPAPGQLVSRFVAAASPEPARLARPLLAQASLALPPATETDGTASIHPDRRLSLSASRLMTYDDCPLRYFYQYTLGVRGPGGVAASMGTVVHAALAGFLDPDRDPGPGQAPERSWAALEAEAQALWLDAGWSETIAPYQPMREQAQRDIFSMLQDWWQAEVARADAAGGWPDVVAVEYRFDITVGGHRVRGSIDRIDRVPGGIAIIDYKTGSRVPRPEEVAQDLQLATYHLAAVRDPLLAAVGPPVSLQLCYLRSGAQPSQPITADHEALTEQRIIDTANRILNEDFQPSVEAECEFCDFWRLCPLQIQGRQVGCE